MEAEEEKEACSSDQKGNIIVVGMSLAPSKLSTELLTWTLAMLTNPGDFVVALHVSSSSNCTDVSRSSETMNQQVDSMYDSVIGVYRDFCSIKQIDFQVKVINNPSVKKALVQEANACSATKLILGVTNKQLALRPTFSLAKYCSKRIPSTCLVIVVENGRVTFERKGSQLNIEANSSQPASSQGLESRSRRIMHQCAQRKSIMSEICSIKKSHAVQNECSLSNSLDSMAMSSQCSCQHGSPDSPVSVLHAYKHVSPRLEGLRSCLPRRVAMCPFCTANVGVCELNQTSVSEYSETIVDMSMGGDKILNAEKPALNSYNHCSDFQRLEERSKDADGTFYLWESRQECLNMKEQTLDPSSDQEQQIDDFMVGSISSKMSERPIVIAKTKATGPGWPLLHQSISFPKVISRSTSHRMSVVEWVLQLPDRNKKSAEQLETKRESITPMHLNCEPRKECTCVQPMTPQEMPLSVCDTNEIPKISTSTGQCGIEISLAEKIDLFCKGECCRRFTFEELEKATCSFSPGKLVGEGGCSHVYQGMLPDGQLVAVKYLNKSVPDAEQEMLTETEILSSLLHRNIITLIGYCIENKNYLLVYNYMSEGNLEQSLYGGKGRDVLPWEIRQKVAIGIAEALDYLHDGCSRPVVHRDVKSSNILLSSYFEPQLADFGLAKWAPTSSIHVTCNDVVGTFGYIAPEYFMYGKVNEKTDIYSFGVVLLELVTGRQPIDTSRPKGQENLVMWAKKVMEDENFSILIDPNLERSYDVNEVKRMILAAALCLRQSPQCRPRMSRIRKLLSGKLEELENLLKQELTLSKEINEGYDTANYGEIDIHNHLAVALLGLDDDVASQAGTEQSLDFRHSKCTEEYLCGRSSRTYSFDKAFS